MTYYYSLIFIFFRRGKQNVRGAVAPPGEYLDSTLGILAPGDDGDRATGDHKNSQQHYLKYFYNLEMYSKTNLTLHHLRCTGIYILYFKK